MTTRYRLANDATDYTLCRELLAAEGFTEVADIAFPTVMAVDDDGEVIGAMATTPHDDMVLAGPLVLRHDKRRPFTAKQLIQLYETTMRGLGIKSFIFQTIGDNMIWQAVNRYFPDLKPYAIEGENRFYVWPLRAEEPLNGQST